MRFLNTLVDVAVKEAVKSEYKIKLGAVIFSGNRILSTGYNEAHRSVRRLHPRFQNYKGSVHAEVAAILKAKTCLRRKKLLVVRYSPVTKRFLLAKPCNLCLSYISYVGIRKIYYSINEYPFIKEYRGE